MVDTSNLGPSESGTGSKTGLVNRDIGNINQPDTQKSSALNGRKRQKSKGFMMESILKTPFQKKQVCIKLSIVAIFDYRLHF